MRIRKISVLATLVLLFSSLAASYAAPSLSGRVVDEKNNPIVGVKVNVTQLGKSVSSFTTGKDGSYTFNLASGAYSMQLVPPSSGYSTLNAYDILLPVAQPITFILTPPTPGRAFLTGHVTTPLGFDLDARTYIGFGNTSSALQDSTGYYKLMPTAGTNSTFSITGYLKGDPMNFKMVGKTPLTLNQDTIAEFRVPLYRQKIRVITSAGIPVAGAYINGGVNQDGISTKPMAAIEGLGAFEGTWSISAMITDANGYVYIPALTLAQPAAAKFSVTPPASYKFSGQSFDVSVGAGDITLKLTNAIPMISGTVKDSSGKAIDKAVVNFSDGTSGSGSMTDSQGRYSAAMAPGSNYRVSIDYRDGAYLSNIVLKSYANSANFAITADTTMNLTVPFEKTKVKVVDGNGIPVANAEVSIRPKPSTFTDYTGSWTLVPGKAPLATYFYATATTDANGIATVSTLHLDSEVDGTIYAQFGTSPNLSYISSTQKIGAGKDLTVTLNRPSINLSGKVTLTDGSDLPAAFGVSFSNGRGQDAQIARSANGFYTGKAFAGITGSWWLGCGRVDISIKQDFCASLIGGPALTINSDTTQDFAIPTYKTQVQVVDPDGKGIPNVKVLINSQMVGNGKVTLFAGKPAFEGYFLTTATTDANGLAQLTSLKLDTPQLAYMELTPDQNTRYQARGMKITVGDNSKNVVVLTIPKPVISSISISTVAGVLTATITGSNFPGVFSVTAGTLSLNEFTNKVGSKTTQGFTVVDENHITFAVPAGLGTVSVTVTNGGGSATSVAFKFN